MSGTGIRYPLADVAMTEACGASLAGFCSGGCWIYLYGELGAGKTTFARGFLRGAGYAGHVKSPTYTLVESYPVRAGTVYHLDLYRIGDPEELELLGMRDMESPDSIGIVEWPQRGAGILPPSDLDVTLTYADAGRELHIRASSTIGSAILEHLPSDPG